MEYLRNPDTGDDIFYHGSKGGIKGLISPSFTRFAADFGDGFYIGTKREQTLARVAANENPFAYKFKVPARYFTKENALFLKTDDWAYFVLYNRKMLEDMSGTRFYDYYAHLADGKDFIVGPIADDVYDKCMKDFRENNITDYVFKELIDSFQYGTQVVAKSEEACNALVCVEERALSSEECKNIMNSRKMTKRERFEYYNEKKKILTIARKGKYLSEIKEEIVLQEQNCSSKSKSFRDYIKERNTAKKVKAVVFPKNIHTEKGVEHEMF